MKHIIFIFCALIIITIKLHAQIGIQTDYPRQIFHIDALQDNPLDVTTPLTVTQEQNDMVIDKNGNIGIGTLIPQNKIHINHDPVITGDAYGLRLTPGYGNSAILTLEGDGKTVKWEPNPSLGKKAQFMFQADKIPYSNNSAYRNMVKISGDINLSGTNAIEISTEGRYLLTLDMMGLAFLDTRYSTSTRHPSIYLYIYKYDSATNTTEMVDAIEHYMAVLTTGQYMSFQSTLYAGYCRPSDKLYILVRPAICFGDTSSNNGYYETNTTNPTIVTIYNI